MSHFDFPRLHFIGQALIDPATGNNNYHYPLVTYEPLSGTVVMPPRIYLDKPEDLELVKSDPSISNRLHRDEYGHAYLLISGVNEAEIFKNWNATPLGEHKSDSEFHSLYPKILTKKEMKPLLGLHPGYWNYFGTMNFTLSKVKINTVQIFENQDLKSYPLGGSTTEFDHVLGAELSFMDFQGRNSAVMIDLAPTLSIYSQVFCDHILLKKGEQILLSGKPLKASLRQMNTRRISNDSTITGSSGIFCTSIPLDQLDSVISKDLIQFFHKYKNRLLPLKGLFLRFDLFNIEEDQYPNYVQMGKISNPAKSSIAGSLTPLYEEEMETCWSGRLLLPKNSNLHKNNLGPTVSQYDSVTNLLSFDLLGSIPMDRGIGDEGKTKIAEMGKIRIGVTSEMGQTCEIDQLDLGKEGLESSGFLKHGGMLDLQIAALHPARQVLDGGGILYMEKLSSNKPGNHDPDEILLMEVPYRILTDQIGIYADQDDDPHLGFRSNKSTREISQMKVLKHGTTYSDTLPVMCVEVILESYGRGHRLHVYEIEDFKDGKQMFWPTDQPGIRFYAFIPSQEGVIPMDIMHYMLTTGNFVNLRVLPGFRWETEVNYEHIDPDTSPIDFAFIYDQFLMHYDLVYPSSGIITPFNQVYLSKIRDYMKKLMADEAWDTYRYMPSTRDLSEGKRKLFFEWLDAEAQK